MAYFGPAGVPEADVPVPTAVAVATGGRPVEPVWRNELGGLTFRITGAGHYVKWSPPGGAPAFDLTAEAERLRWAGSWAAVPSVVAAGADDTGSWLLTTALPGTNAVDSHWVSQPARTVPALGRALRALHDVLPVAQCPFSWEPEVLRVAGPPRPPVLRPVVCHGDACAPNTLLDDDPADPHGPALVTGNVDLARLGVGDPWVDLAIATWSTRWNYGPGWEDALLDAYGVEPDPDRCAYYRWLWGGAPPDA